MQNPSVAIVIIHWNQRNLLQQFLPSVCSTQYPNLQIWLADNASEDDSVQWVKENFPAVRILELENNYGYAGGYNHALKQIQADYYILLNNDVEVPEAWIDPVIRLMESNPKIAAAQPKLLQYHQRDHFEYAGGAGGFMDPFGYVFCRGRIFETLEEDLGHYNDNRKIFWASGACLFMRASAFHEMNGFDENFFAHMEEIDLCWRLQLSGYEIWYCGESHVFHLGGSTLQKASPKKTYLNFRNSLQMILKNSPASRLWWLIPARSTLDLLSSIFFLMNGRSEHSAMVHKAHSDFFFKWRKWWRARKTVTRKVAFNQLSGMYPGSVVYEHFVSGKEKFEDLGRVEKITG